MIPFLHGAFAPNGVFPSSYELIESQTVGAGGSSSVTFTVPAGYQHFQIRGIARSTYAATFVGLRAQLNNDTGSSYTQHTLYGDGGGTAVSGAAGGLQTALAMTTLAGSSLSASVFGIFTVDALDYASTTKNKTVRGIGGTDANGSGYVQVASGVWINTSAITSIKLYDSTGGSWAQYSTFSLYGIKGT